jgi:hypothetical protein
VAKQNCWEFLDCGREPGGAKVEELEVCPAAVDTRADGINGGKNGGRACWAIVGSFAGKIPSCPFPTAIKDCFGCKFYWLVSQEEGSDFVTGTEILIRLHIFERGSKG